MSFEIKDVNCNFLLQGGFDERPGPTGDRRTLKPTTAIKMAQRGENFGRDTELPCVVPGVVVGYYSTAVPRMTNPADFARYESAERGSFEAFNFIYKVWTPCIKAELNVEDFEDKNKKQFLKKVASMADVTVSLGANEVQGAIPPGTLVDVGFESLETLKNPQIVKIKEKVFDISSVFPDPPGRPFVLGSAGTMGGSFGGAGGVGDTSWYRAGDSEEPFIPAPNNPNVKVCDPSPIRGVGLYLKANKPQTLKGNEEKVSPGKVPIISKLMDEAGIKNRYMRIAFLGVMAKESGIGRRMIEKGWDKAAISKIRDKFGDKAYGADGKVMPDAKLEALKMVDKKFFSHIYGGLSPVNAGEWSGHRAGGKYQPPLPDGRKYDGFKYVGRGLNGLTYKASYIRYGKMIGVDLEKNPGLLATFPVAAKLAVAMLATALDIKGTAKKRKSPNLNWRTCDQGPQNQQEANMLAAGANAGWGKYWAKGTAKGVAISNSINSVNKTSAFFE